MNMAEASPPPPREGASSEPLSPELWAIIARRALAAEDSSVQAWARLSLVSPAFRSAVAGVPLVASFAGENLTEAQRDWLGSTPLPLRKVMFHRTNGASTALFQAASGCALAGSDSCLEELRNVHVPYERTGRARLQPLSRFGSLRALTLCRVFGSRGDPAMTAVLRQLPTSLEELTLDSGPDCRTMPHGLHLGYLERLRQLTLLKQAVYGLQDIMLGEAKTPPLPASLRTLRIEAAGKSRRDRALTSLARRTLLTAADPGPVLQVCAEQVEHGLSWSHVYGEDGNTGATTVTTDLPAGFSALWMETTDIGLSCGMEPFDAQPDVADQLCRLLSCAPDSYRELRLGPSATAPIGAADRYQLGVELTWQIGTRGTPERVQQDTHVVMGGGVKGVARELERVAAGHGLTVSVLDSRQCITLSRT